MENKQEVKPEERKLSPVLEEYLSNLQKQFASEESVSEPAPASTPTPKEEQSKAPGDIQDETQAPTQDEASNESNEEPDIKDVLSEALGLSKKEKEELIDISEEDLENMDKDKVKQLYTELQQYKIREQIEKEASMIDNYISKLPEHIQQDVEKAVTDVINSDIYDALKNLDIEKRVATIISTALGASGVINKANEVKKEVKKIVKEVKVSENEGSNEAEVLIELLKRAREGDKKAYEEYIRRSGKIDDILVNYKLKT